MGKVKFKDLSGWMKVAAIGGMITFISFVLGFVWGFLGAI